MSISHSVLLRMINASDESCRENEYTHFMSNYFFNRAVYEIMWKNRAGQATDDNMAHTHYMLDA